MSDDAPKRHADIVIDPAIDRHRIVNHPSARRYFRLGVREAAFLEMLDGSRSVGELKHDDGLALTPGQIDRLIEWFRVNNLLETPGNEPAQTKPWSARDAAVLFAHPDRWRLHLINPDRFLDRHRNIVEAFFSRPAFGIYLSLILLPALVCIVSPNLVDLTVVAVFPKFTPAGWGVLYLMMVSMNVLHELAHAISCKYFGGRVERIGLMFMYLHPVLYCNISDIWRFRDPNQKIIVSFAGVFLQLMLTCAAVTAWLFSTSPVILYFIFLNTSIAIFNLFPFIKLDGYWMLVHLLDEPNLIKKGLWSVDQLIRQLIRRSDSTPDRVKPVIVVFGIFHTLSVPLFWGLGLYSIYYYGSKVSEIVAWMAATAVGVPLAYRAIRAGAAYAKSFSTENRSWRPM
jgi:putative peptide zinc metalloprotease protein